MYTDGGIGAAEHCVHMTLAGLQQVVSSLHSQPEPPRPTALRQQYVIECTTSDEITTSRDWTDSCALLVMPGGRDLPYVTKLRGRGNKHIRDFVRDGGGYLGLCAGGYYGASFISFARGDRQLEVIGSRELGFFPGMAEGPTFPGFQYNSNVGARAAGVSITPEGKRILGLPEGIGEEATEDSRSVSAFYNGGCHFVHRAEPQSMETAVGADLSTNSPNPFSVLATYSRDQASSPPPDPWAIVACSVGRGRAVLSGVHLEANTDTLRACFAGDKHVDSLLPHLEVCEEQRQRLFTGIVKHLLQED